MAVPCDAHTDLLKTHKSSLINSYAIRSNATALRQVLATVLPYILLFSLAIASTQVSYGLTALLTLVLMLFVLRVFVLMHDCGHNCLFASPRLNAVVGFILGVMCGVPQYVWSKHHDFHHATNGNWDKYRGPLTVKSVDEYALLSDAQKRSYVRQRKLYMGPLAGLMYFIINPRWTWIKGSTQWLSHVIHGKLADPQCSVKDLAARFSTGYWNNAREYWHMAANNLVLISVLTLVGMQFGFVDTLGIFVVAVSLAGAIGIILFSIQHNFEGAHAATNDEWDYYESALYGTSFLQLPAWLNWFTADIAYHHIHHLSARIPNYQLAACHREYQQLFTVVPRLGLADVSHSMQYILWDNHQQKLITVADFEASYGRGTDPEPENKVLSSLQSSWPEGARLQGLAKQEA